MADGQMLRVIVYDYQDNYVCDIDPAQIVELKSTEEVNGEHSLSIKTTQELEKTNRLVIRDGMGIWHEYVVTGLVGEHGGRKVGAVVHTYHAVWSLQYDLSATYIDTQVGLVPGHPSVPSPAIDGLRAALSGTARWQVGTVTVTDTGSASFYRRSGWEGIKTLTESWGGEVAARIEVGSTGVTARYVDFLSHEGNAQATRRFDYGGDVSKIKRTVSDEIWPCRIVPLGKSTETEAGGYTRRPTIAAANGGVVWIEDASSVPYTRIPDGRGGWEYPTLIVKNDIHADPAALKAWALEHVGEYTRPQVTYEADVVQLVKAGMNPHGVALGDNVIVVDRSFGGDGLAIDARVIKIVQSLIDSTDVKLTIGNARRSISTALGGLTRDVERIDEQQVLATAYQTTAAYMAAVLDRLNAEINATGGYWYMIPGIGTRTYDVEVSDPAVGSEASKVVEVRGGNIRIADSRTAAGEWDWKTVFDSGHVLADLVTAAKLTAGYIGSAESGNYWNLDTGQLRIAASSYLGDRTVEQVLANVSATITGVDVEYAQGTSPTQAPSSGWQTQPPAWEEGKYIWQRTATTTAEGTDYSAPVMISGKDGADGTSVTIRGSYDTLAELQAAHPTGSDGDAYMVGTDLYVWNGSAWEDVGQIQGPQGPAGTSVTVSSIQYGTSASASTAPTSWSTTPPTSIAAGRWLWVKTNYSNGSTATTKSYVGTNGTSVYVQSSTKVDGVTTIVLASSDGTTSTIRIADGEDGATGQRGPAGENGVSSYVHMAWANSQDGTVDFSTKDSAGKSYLGVYTDQNIDDPTTPSSYSWSRIEGAAGSDGVGVSGVTEQYYLSTSSGSPTGGTWQDSPPAFREGRFYFTRVITTYTDGHVVIQDPVLARGLNSANKNALDAAKTATDYLTFDNGLNVGYSGSQAKAQVRADGVGVYNADGEESLFVGAKDGHGYARVGEADKMRTEIDYHSFNLIDRDDVTYFNIIDMRDDTGVATMTFTTVGYNGTNGVVGIMIGVNPSKATVKSLTINGVQKPFTKFSMSVDSLAYLIVQPYSESGVDTSNDTFVVTFTTTQAEAARAMTFGTRTSGNGIGPMSISMGTDCVSAARNSFATGLESRALGSFSFAAGRGTVAASLYAATFGYLSQGLGRGTVAGGVGTVANRDGSAAFGMWNVNAYSHIFSLGGGTNTARKDVMYVTSDGAMWIAKTLTQNSDRRLKEHHAYLGDDAAEFIRQLRPALYSKDGERHVGFYAQDVQEVEPDGWDTATVSAQHTDESLGFDPLTLDYTALIAPLVAYCQQLERRIEELEAR